MPDSIDFHPLFTQLQARYPASSLVAELVQIHEGNFLVRAIVEVSGTPLATSMAAAATPESAEDQARLRVLKLLGISAFAPALRQSIQPPTYELPSSLLPSTIETETRLPAPEPDSVPTALPSLKDATPPISRSEPLTGIAPLPFDFSSVSESPRSTFPPLGEVDPFSESEDTAPVAVPTVAPTKLLDSDAAPPKSRNGKSRSTAAPESPPKQTEPPAPAMEDLSSLIAQTDMELERIGWTREKGQKHLMRTYSKRSRQQLTDEELLDFLTYLKGCPSPSELPFHS